MPFRAKIEHFIKIAYFKFLLFFFDVMYHPSEFSYRPLPGVYRLIWGSSLFLRPLSLIILTYEATDHFL